MNRLLQLSVLGLSVFAASAVQAQFFNCTNRPDLCERPVASEIQTPNLAQAQDVVFLGDGYTASQQSKFAEDVNRLVNELKSLSGGHASVGLDPTLFNYHRVDVTSATSNLANDDFADTAFSAKAVTGEPIYYNSTALLFAAAQNAPDVDTVVLLVNADAGRANATTPTSHISGGHLVMPAAAGAHLLSHELGHAIFRLGDEYADSTGCYSGSELQLAFWPNLAIDAEGRKFGRAYADPSTQPAPVEGAWYPQCMYRPAAECKMRATHAEWCPVCAHQMRLRLEEKRHNDDREMPFSGLSGISPDTTQAAGVIDLFVNGDDARGITESELWIDGTLRWTDPYRPYVWDTRTETPGTHVITTRAVDTSGKSNDDGIEYEVVVVRDTQPPSIAIQSPTSGSTFTDTIPFHATATDDTVLGGWDLYIDGVHVTHYQWYEQAPAQSDVVIDINIEAYADGPHVLTLAVWDTADNRATASVDVVFQNTANDWAPDVTILQPAPEATVSGSVPVQATASGEEKIVRVELLVDGTLVSSRTKKPYNFVWDSSVWPNGKHTLVARAIDAESNTGFSAPVPLWVNNSAAWSVLLVSGAETLTPAEQAIKARLAAEHGAAVTTVAARKAKAADAQGKQLVIISPSAPQSAVTTKFRRVAVGVLCLNAQLFNDHGLTGRAWGTQAGTKAKQSKLTIVSPDHPLAGGLRGRSVRVTRKAADFGWGGLPSANAVVAATIVGEPDHAASFGYESGTAMVGGFIAPARRTGLFTTESAINGMQAGSKGWALWDAAVKWTAGR